MCTILLCFLVYGELQSLMADSAMEEGSGKLTVLRYFAAHYVLDTWPAVRRDEF